MPSNSYASGIPQAYQPRRAGSGSTRRPPRTGSGEQRRAVTFMLGGRLSAAAVYDVGMRPMLPDPVFDAAAGAARATAGLDLLILFGSRARGDARPGADWDFGYLADEAADVPALLAALVEALEDDHVDLVDLRRAGGCCGTGPPATVCWCTRAPRACSICAVCRRCGSGARTRPSSSAGTAKSWRPCRERSRPGGARRADHGRSASSGEGGGSSNPPWPTVWRGRRDFATSWPTRTSRWA